MIWIAAGVELTKASSGYGGWEDFGVLLVLQFANATVGYIEERNAGDAIAALKQQLAPQCHVCRDGIWQNMAGASAGLCKGSPLSACIVHCPPHPTHTHPMG